MANPVDPSVAELGEFDHHDTNIGALHALYADLHERSCPVAHSESYGGYYMLVGHDEVKAAAGSWRRFSSARGIMLPKAPFQIAAIEFDPPQHTFWRELYREVLNLTTYRWFQERIAEQIATMIARFAPNGRAELVAELTDPLPVMTICEIIGIHEAERALEVRRIALDVFAAGRDSAATVAALERFAAFCLSEIDARRRDPREDFLTRLGTQPADGALLSDEQIVNLLIGFLVAGHHTTSSAMTSMVFHVARQPELRDRLVADPTLIPRAIEETIRLDTPLHGFFRQTTSDTDVGGTTIPERSEVMLNYAAANRDPTTYEHPDRFDLNRPSGAHLGFGHGIHSCVGAQLARLELKLTLGHILERLPDITYTGGAVETQWSGGNLHMIDRLDVTFTPTRTESGV